MEKISVYINRITKRVYYGSIIGNAQCLIDITDLIDEKHYIDDIKHRFWGWKDITLSNPLVYKIMKAYKEAMERKLSEYEFLNYSEREVSDYPHMVLFEVDDMGRRMAISLHAVDVDHLKEFRDFILTKPYTHQKWLMRH